MGLHLKIELGGSFDDAGHGMAFAARLADLMREFSPLAARSGNAGAQIQEPVHASPVAAALPAYEAPGVTAPATDDQAAATATIAVAANSAATEPKRQRGRPKSVVAQQATDAAAATGVAPTVSPPPVGETPKAAAAISEQDLLAVALETAQAAIKTKFDQVPARMGALMRHFGVPNIRQIPAERRAEAHQMLSAIRAEAEAFTVGRSPAPAATAAPVPVAHSPAF